MEVDRDIDLIN